MLQFNKLSKLIRYYVLLSTTSAGSGHVTSSLSSVELATCLFFKHLRYDLENPENPLNDHLIFSKGHASPLFYSLFAAAGKVTEKELKQMRDFNSRLEGHPSMRFAYTEAPTGSLGQGLSVGVGIALNEKYLDKHDCRVFVLLGDGETAEGQVWEAVQVAAHYKLNNLFAILDVNRLGQSGETMLGSNINKYEEMFKSFGWRTYLVDDGHDPDSVDKAFEYLINTAPGSQSPAVIIARTVKGKGVSFLEDKDNWHGKALDKAEFEKAVKELGEVEKTVSLPLKPDWPHIHHQKHITNVNVSLTTYKLGEGVSTRKAYGKGLARLGKVYSDVISLDADVKNSTYSEEFSNKFPDRFFEMYIAEQNMVSVGLGLASKGKVPYISTFAAFLTRAHDQIRMADLSGEHLVFCGSHAGVSIGEDGPSQMGLEDMALFRSRLNSTVFYPADAVSTEKLIEVAYGLGGIVYIRTTRKDTPILYKNDEEFISGGSKIIKKSGNARVCIAGAGITVHEALAASDKLESLGVNTVVLDCYSVKPVDAATLKDIAKSVKNFVVVEDHYREGGLGDAVTEVLVNEKVNIFKMGITKVPRSGKPEELLDYEDIFAEDIVIKVRQILK